MPENQQLAAFFRLSPVAVSIVDPDTAVFIEVNEAFERVFGWSRGEAVGRHGDDLPIWTHAERTRFLDAVNASGGSLREFPTKRLRKGGEAFDTLVSTEIIEFGGRRFRLNSIVDVTAEVRAREESDRELEAFSYSVSHDLRAPVRAIASFTEILRHDYGELLPAEAVALLERVTGAAERMGGLVDALLELARLMRRPLARIDLDLSALAAQQLRAIAEQEPARCVATRVAPALRANADPVLAASLIENLLLNAWKYTAARPDARIEFGCSNGAFYVRDNGAGFDMRYVGKMFKPFERLHGEAEFPGIGIGLATVERIVRRHGGRVWAEGAQGAGATFYFTLPG